VSALLFGGQSHGRAHRESDVDVAVLLDRGLHPTRLDRSNVRVNLTSALIGVLHRNEVDVVVLNDVPPLFARRILHEGPPLAVADADADRAFGDLVRSRAADLQPWLARMERLKLEALKR
jgi:predicted nucleotidyltransferase